MNNCIFTGAMTCDPKVTRVEKAGKKIVIAEFGLGVSKDYVKPGDSTADFPWFKCYGKQAELVEKYLQKGRKVFVEAIFRSQVYKTKSGSTGYKNWFDIHRIEFGDNKHVENGEVDTGAYIVSKMDISGLEGADFLSENPNA